MTAATSTRLREHPALALILLAYAALGVFCVWGHPPPVDLPAHGAELQTLVDLLRGERDVAQVYRVTFPVGYGLITWLSLPVAALTNGGLAVRLALLVTLWLYPLALCSLLRAFGRSPWMVVLGLPLAFNISYWYGLLSGLLAQVLLFFALAAYERLLREPAAPGRLRSLLALNALAAGVLLSHLLAFVVLGFLLTVRALVAVDRRAALRTLAAGVALPLLVSLPQALRMGERAVVPGDQPATEYALASHVNWFFKNYVPEGKLGVLVPLLVCAVLLALYLVHRRQEPIAPFALFAAMALLYAVTPKTLSGIFLISVRLPVLAGALSLLLVDARRLPRAALGGLGLLAAASLGESAIFHARFRDATHGLMDVTPHGRRPPHGYLSLAGKELLGSRQIYLQHLGQWVTATRGGVGHDFFADADHHAVRFVEGRALPGELWEAAPDVLARFEELYVYGEGALPQALTGWREVARSARWRRMVPP
jgi:hypothetical protein